MLSNAPFIMNNTNNDANKIIQVKQGDIAVLSIDGLKTNDPVGVYINSSKDDNFPIYKRDGNIVYFKIPVDAQLGIIDVFFDSDTTTDRLIFHNAIEVIKGDPVTSQTRRFPSSVTVNGVTTNLDYGYIFKPQSQNDYKDYSPNNLAGVKLITKNYYDIPAPWVNDNGSWGIDFSNFPFSALEVPDGNYEFGTQYTTIALVKLVNDDTTNISANDGYLLSKWWSGSFSDHSKQNYFSNRQYGVTNTNQGKDRYTGDVYYVFGTDNSVTEKNNKFILTESLNTTLNLRSIVKNQEVFSNSIYSSTSIGSVTNGSGRMFLGNFVSEGYYPNLLWGSSLGYWVSNQNNLKGVLYGFAIVKQALSEPQIKELHRQMGF